MPKKTKTERFTIKLPAKYADRVIDAYADARGYQEKVDMGEGLEPNPVSRREYAELRLREHMQQVAVEQEGTRAAAEVTEKTSKELGDAFADL